MHLVLALLLATAIQITNPEWKDAPPSMPLGTRMAVLEGNPKEPGMFTTRLWLPAGSKIAAHTHPRAERVTVLSGKVTLLFSDGKTSTFTAGGFYVTPPDVPHSLTLEEETVVQLTCEGPWELKYVH